MGVPNWLAPTTKDRAVVQDGRFLSVTDATWEKIESFLGNDALELSTRGYVLTVFRFGTGLGDSNFSCVNARSGNEFIDARWRFVVDDFQVIVLLSTEIFEEAIQAAIIPHHIYS